MHNRNPIRSLIPAGILGFTNKNYCRAQFVLMNSKSKDTTRATLEHTKYDMQDVPPVVSLSAE
jgi:hypothetical protein